MLCPGCVCHAVWCSMALYGVVCRCMACVACPSPCVVAGVGGWRSVQWRRSAVDSTLPIVSPCETPEAEHLTTVRAERDRQRKEAEEVGDVSDVVVVQELKPKKKKTFFEEISKDEDCCVKYVKDVLRGFNNCAVKLGDQLKFWISAYQPLVCTDKDSFIRRYKKQEKSTSSVGQDISKYKEMQNEIQQKDPKVAVDFIETDFTPLKNALIKHCQDWQSKLINLLNERARNDMQERLDYFETNTRIFKTEPLKDMDELKFRINLLEQCRKDNEETHCM